MTVSKSKQSGILYGVFGRFDLAALLRLPHLKFLFVLFKLAMHHDALLHDHYLEQSLQMFTWMVML